MIQFVQSKSVQTSGATSITTPAMTSVSGDFLAAAVSTYTNTISGFPVSDNRLSPWLTAWVNNTGGEHAGLYYVKSLVGGSGHTVTLTVPGGADSAALAIAEFSGVDTSSPLGLTSVAQSVAAPHVSGSIQAQVGQLLLGCGSSSVNVTNASGQPASSPGLFTDVAALLAGITEGQIQSYAIVSAIDSYRYEFQYIGSAVVERVAIATYKGANIAFLQAKSVHGFATSVTTPSMATTSAHFLSTVGNAFLRTYSGAPITDSAANSWSTAVAVGGLGVAYAANIIGNAAHTVTFTPVGGSDDCALSVAEFSGVALSSPLDKTSSASPSAVRFSSGLTAATSQANELLIGGGSVSHASNTPYSTLNGVWNASLASPWTDDVAIASGGAGVGQGILFSHAVTTTPGAYAFGFSNGSVGGEIVGIASFKPVGSALPGDSLCGATIPLFYGEVALSSGTVSYSWGDQPINDATIQRQPRIVALSKLRRELSDRTGRLVINSGTVTLTDYDGVIRALINAGRIIRTQIDFYGVDDPNRRVGGIPYRVGQFLITEYKLGADMTVELTFEDRFGGDSLKDLLTKPLPFRKLTPTFNPTLPIALVGMGEPIPYGLLSDETVGFPTVQVWYTGERTLNGTLFYEGLIAGCVTGLPVSAWGWDGAVYLDGGQAVTDAQAALADRQASGTATEIDTAQKALDAAMASLHRQVKLGSTLYDTDVAMPGTGALWASFSSTPYRVINGRRYMVLYLRAGSDVGEDFKLFASSNGSQGTPVHVNLRGIEDVGDSTGTVITSLPRQWQHLIAQFVEQNHSTDANWYPLPLSGNTPAYAVINADSVELTKTRSEARMSPGYLGAQVIGFDLTRGPLGDVLQRMCIAGDFDMFVDRHGRACLSMEDRTANPVKNFTITNVLQDTYTSGRDWSTVVNAITYDTFKNCLQTNTSVTLRPSSAAPPTVWLTAQRSFDDGGAISDNGGDPGGRRELKYEDWVTRDVTLVTSDNVAAHKLTRQSRGLFLHQLETDLCGLDVELGDLFTITHFAGVTSTLHTVRCTAIELEPPDPFTKRWAVRLFGYEIESSIAATTVTLIVSGGTGGGIYAVGAVVSIRADPPPVGQVFSLWTGGTVDSSTSSSTFITIPAHDVVLTAHYFSATSSTLVIACQATVAFTGTSTAGLGTLTIASATDVEFVGSRIVIGLGIDAVATVSLSGRAVAFGQLVAATATAVTFGAVGQGRLTIAGAATVSWVSGSAPGHIALAWNANPTADNVLGYLVEWGTSPGLYTNSRDAGNVLSYSITGLIAGKTYYLSIKAYNSTGYSGEASEVSGVATS